MLYFDKFGKESPEKTLHHLNSFLNDPENFGETSDYPQPIDVPMKKELTLIEELFTFDGPPDATVSIGGEEYYYFSGEGYLGLQANPEVLAATCEAVLHYGTSVGSSRHRYTPVPIFDVQRQTAEIYGTEQALYCPSVSDALEFLLETIAHSYDLVLIDELCGDITFSVVTRAFAPVGIKPVPFKHGEVADLERILKKKMKTRSQRTLIITDGVFHVTGTIAPIPEYYHLLENYPDAAILIDDSEGIGVLGGKGRGTLEYYGYDAAAVNRTRQDGEPDPTYGIGEWGYGESGEPDFDLNGSSEFDSVTEDGEDGEFSPDSEDLEEDDFIFLDPEDEKAETLRSVPVKTYLVASLAKAIGGFGAIIPGSARFLDRIRDLARFQWSAFPPTPLAAATLKGLQLSFHQEEIRHKLWNNVYYFKSELKKLGFEVPANMVPIVSLATGSDQNMRRIQREMISEQILVSFLQKMNSRRPESSIRVALFANHERVMLDIFLDTLQRTL